MTTQHAKWLEECAAACRGARRSPSLNFLLTSTCWRNDHNGFSHQGPGFIDTMLSKQGDGRPRLPAARRQLPALGRRPLPAQHELREPHRHRQAAAAAVARHRRGARALRARRVGLGVGGHRRRRRRARRRARVRGRRRRRSRRSRPRVAPAPHAPELRVRVVNVVDLMTLFSPRDAPARHAPTTRSSSCSPPTPTSCFAFHGYPRRGPPAPARAPERRRASTCAAIRRRARRRRRSTWSCSTRSAGITWPRRQCTALARSRSAPRAVEHCQDMLRRHHAYVREHLDDMPEVRDWIWT